MQIDNQLHVTVLFSFTCRLERQTISMLRSNAEQTNNHYFVPNIPHLTNQKHDFFFVPNNNI